MQIESARELKALCFRQYVAPMMATPRALGLRSRALSTVDPTRRSVALGIARKNGRQFQLAVRVQSRSVQGSQYVEGIIKEAKGEADVRYVGEIVKRAPWNQIRQRPLLIGTSIGHYLVTAGTLGCFVKTRADGTVRILSNNHVLANENSATTGDAILQPGSYDGGATASDTAGQLDQFVTLDTTAANSVDAATATVGAGIQYDKTTLNHLGTLAGVGGSPVDGDVVSKTGRTTDLTHGRVTAFEMDNVIVGYDLGNLRFDNQIEIEGAADASFSQGGDSGSVIVNTKLEAVGLLFAGADQGGTNGKGLTYANPIARVFDALAVDLLY
jgi:hypothetical protein